MSILTIDMGNTRTHCALVDSSGALKAWDCPTKGFSESCLDAALSQKGVEGVSWCSVVPKESALLHRALDEKCALPAFHLNADTSPIPLDVKEPMQVGQDRIASAIGAREFLEPPYIVVDMGTAMTIDLVDAEGAYAGGAIAPGFYAFTDYLGERTAQLPVIDPAKADWDMIVGKNTVEAMQIGCVKGFCRMADSIIEEMARAFLRGAQAHEKELYTGGSISLLPKIWLAGRKVEANLANIGLYKAFYLNKSRI